MKLFFDINNIDNELLDHLSSLESVIVELNTNGSLDFIIETHQAIKDFMTDFILGPINKMINFTDRVFERKCVTFINRIRSISQIRPLNYMSNIDSVSINVYSGYLIGVLTLVSAYFNEIRVEIKEMTNSIFLMETDTDFIRLYNLILLTPECLN